MSTSFDQTAETFLGLIGLAAHVRRSVRAPSYPAIGLDRTGSAFDYVFLTEDTRAASEKALCFLQPNPTPPLFVRVPLTCLTYIEWNGSNVFFGVEDEAEILFAEGRKGWGTKIKAVTVENVQAKDFFGLWTRWGLNPRDLDFVAAVASAAGMARADAPAIADAGVSTWSRTRSAPESAPDSGTDDPPVPDAQDPTSGGSTRSVGEATASPVRDRMYAGVTDMIGQGWLVEVEDGTIVRALNTSDWDEDDLARIIRDGKFDAASSRALMDERFESPDEVEDGLLELRVSEVGLPYDVKGPR